MEERDFKIDSPIQDVFFKAPKKYFRMMGMWPEDNVYKWKNIGLVTFSFVTLIIIGMGQCAYIVDNFNENLNDSFDVICSTCCVWISLMKLFVLFCLKQRLKRIIIFLKHVWFNDQSSISISINSAMAKSVNKITVVLVVGGFSAIVVYVMGPIVLNIQRLSTGQSYMRLLSFKSKYPFRTDTSPIYELTYIYVSISGFIVVLAYGCVDGIFITLCVYIAAQFKIVQQNLAYLSKAKGLGTPTFDNKYSKHECEQMLKHLSRIIQRHVDTMKLTNDVSKLFEIIVLIQFLTAAVNIGLVVTRLTMSSSALEVILYSFVGFVYLIQLYIYCYGGTYVMKTSAEVSVAAYDVKWYLYDKRVAKSIKLIILTAQQGSCIKVRFVQVSANTFLNILSTAGSYITILKTFI